MTVEQINARIAKNHTYLLEMKDVNKYMEDYDCTIEEYINRYDRIVADSNKHIAMLDN